MLTYDPRSISSKVYSNLQALKDKPAKQTDQKEQKVQAVELYNYVATWGLLRLKAEEFALLSQPQKQQVVKCFFITLQEIAFPESETESSTQPETESTPETTSSQQDSRLITPPVHPLNSPSPNTPTAPAQKANSLLGKEGLNYLTQKELSASDYLGLTGLALQVAREFAFWAEAIYPKDKK